MIATYGDLLAWVGENIGNHDVLEVYDAETEFPCFSCVVTTNTGINVYFEYDDTGYRGVDKERTGDVPLADLEFCRNLNND